MPNKKDLSQEALKIYKEIFNEFIEESPEDKQKAHKKAWNVIKKNFERSDKTGKWQKRDH